MIVKVAISDRTKSISKVFCPFCHSSRLVKKGKSKTKSGLKQKYVCFNCTKLTVKALCNIEKGEEISL